MGNHGDSWLDLHAVAPLLVRGDRNLSYEHSDDWIRTSGGTEDLMPCKQPQSFLPADVREELPGRATKHASPHFFLRQAFYDFNRSMCSC
nr:hypothetical protein CFP56_76763 [Quercus suber]